MRHVGGMAEGRCASQAEEGGERVAEEAEEDEWEWYEQHQEKVADDRRRATPRIVIGQKA